VLICADLGLFVLTCADLHAIPCWPGSCLQVYYHNSITGDSSWTEPEGFVGPTGEGPLLFVTPHRAVTLSPPTLPLHLHAAFLLWTLPA
jgi:hypothetical protein